MKRAHYVAVMLRGCESINTKGTKTTNCLFMIAVPFGFAFAIFEFSVSFVFY